MRDPNLVRKEMLELNEVLPFVLFPPAPVAPVESESDAETDATPGFDPLVMIKGDLINMASVKMQNFVKNGTRCDRCKCEGEYFAKEKYSNIPFYHLNLYAMKTGRETQMVKDLIVAPNKGGLDTVENSRTLCFDCHKKKVNTPPDEAARQRKRAKKRSENRKKKAAGEVKVKVGEKKPKK